MATGGNGHKGYSTDSIIYSPMKERSQSNLHQFQDEARTHWKMERNNLLSILKISIKTLIESSLQRTRTLDETFFPLKQFFIVMEHVFNHGLKGKRSIFGAKRDFLSLLESMGDRIFTMKEILTSIHNLPTIRTHDGKSRAWLRMALMQKVLAQQLQAMIEDKEHIEEWYESYAMMLNEECIVISGLLVGLNVIDCNLDLKGEDLDSSIGIVDLSLYLRDGNCLEKAAIDESDTVNYDQKLEMILDQKAYLEEMNRRLTESAKKLQARVSHLEEEKEAAKKELSSLSSKYWDVVEDCNQLKQENLQLKGDLDRRLQIAEADINVERMTYHQSRISLNEMYLQVKQQLEVEVEHCKEIQQDLQSQVSMNQEKEVAMRLLERDVHEKQDTLMSLRQQLEEVKKIDAELHTKQKNL